MTITTLSSRELNQDVAKAKNAAQDGPVFITDRGRDYPCAAEFRGIPASHTATEQHCRRVGHARCRGHRICLRAWRSVSSRLIFDDVRSRYQRRFGAPEGANRQNGQKPAGREFNRRRTHAFVSAITIMELETGVLQIERRDTAQVRFCGRGSMGMSCRSSRVACCRSILRSRNDAHDSMYRIGGRAGRTHCRNGARAWHDRRDAQFRRFC